MRIFILNESKMSLGGGWTFIRNFTKGVKQSKLNMSIVPTWQEADIVFVPSASMVTRDTANIIKGAGKKMVVRLDNIPRNSRNRGAGTTRLYDITQLADKVIYQSLWSRNYLMPFLGKYGEIIYNGVDTDIYKKDGDWENFGNYHVTYLYSRYSRDETKLWEVAWYDYQMVHRLAKENGISTKLVIVGRFSEDLIKYDFDFYNGEHFQYLGVVDNDEKMARIMRGCDILLAPYYNDCYSNTMQEAMACGLTIEVNETGGNQELKRNGAIPLKTMVTNYYNSFHELLQTTT